MTQTFQPGDKIKCISVNGHLEEGRVYTFISYRQGGKLLAIKELPDEYYPHRFELFRKGLHLDEETARLTRKFIKIIYETTNSRTELEDAKRVLAKFEELDKQ